MRAPRPRAAVAVTALTLSTMLAGPASSVMSTAFARTSTGQSAATASATVTAPDFPTFVQLPADQAAHPYVTQKWWYVVGHLSAHGHRFWYEVQIVAGQAPESVISITDQTTGKFCTQSQGYTPFRPSELSEGEPSDASEGPVE